MKKRVIALLLVLITVLCVPFSVSAASSDIVLYGFRNFDSEESPYAFVSFSPAAPAKVTELSKQAEQPEIFCGTSFGGNIYAVDKNGMLYKVDTQKFVRTEIGTAIEDTTAYRPVEMAYDITQNKMYLLCLDLNNVNANALFTLDVKSGTTVFQSYIIGAAQLKGFTFDGAGQAYGIGETGMLYKIDAHTGRAFTIGATGFEGTYIQSMCYDRTTDLIYWAFYDGESGKLISVDPATAAATDIGAIGNNSEISALCMASDAYAIEVIAEEGGIAYVSGEKYYNAGESAALVAEVTNGYEFGGWKVSGGTLSTTGEVATTVTMPSGDVTVTAFFLPKKVYQERTLYSDSAKVTVSGKKLYYNTQLSVTPWAEGTDGYDMLIEEMGPKRTLISANNINLQAFAVEETKAFNKSVKVTIPVGAEYEGKKVNIYRFDGEKIIKSSEKVKEGLVTLKLKEAGHIAITTHRGASFWAVFFLILLLGALIFFVYAFRDVILKSIKKDMRKINSKLKAQKKEKNEKEQSENIMAALDEQDLDSSRYNINE